MLIILRLVHGLPEYKIVSVGRQTGNTDAQLVSYTDFIALAPSRQTVCGRWRNCMVFSDWMAYVIARHHANLITTVSIGHSGY